MIDAVKITHDPLIPEMVLFFQISTSGQRGSLSGMMKTSQTTSISSQTTSNQPLKPDLFLPNHIVHLPNHICYLSNHITYLSNQIVLLPNQIIPLSNQIMMWFGRFSGCRKCSRSNRKGNFQKRKLPVISVSHKLLIPQSAYPTDETFCISQSFGSISWTREGCVSGFSNFDWLYILLHSEFSYEVMKIQMVLVF